jgi:hypothetical protein
MVLKKIFAFGLLFSSSSVANPAQFTLYYSSQNSDLSANVISYLGQNSNQSIVLFDVATNKNGWQRLYQAVQPCHISETHAGVPILIEKNQVSGKTVCHMSDVGVLERLKAYFETSVNTEPSNRACSSITKCVVSREAYTRGGWKTVWTKSSAPKKLCEREYDSSHTLQLEPELGLNLQVMDLDGSKSVVADLFTYKLTHVVASSSTTLDATTFSFMHRMTPRSDEVVKVNCRQ